MAEFLLLDALPPSSARSRSTLRRKRVGGEPAGGSRHRTPLHPVPPLLGRRSMRLALVILVTGFLRVRSLLLAAVRLGFP